MYKKGNCKECMNYRKISLSSLPGKVHAKFLIYRCNLSTFDLSYPNDPASIFVPMQQKNMFDKINYAV